MLNYEEELRKFKPSLEVDQIEEAVYKEDLAESQEQQEEKTENKPQPAVPCFQGDDWFFLGRAGSQRAEAFRIGDRFHIETGSSSSAKIILKNPAVLRVTALL